MILMSYRTPYVAIKNKTRKNFVDEEFDRFFNSDAREGDSEDAVPVGGTMGEEEWPTAFGEAASKRTGGGGGDSPASPQTPLYDEDTSQPLEEYPARYVGDGWEMMLRHPAKKKLTANRYWKKVWARFIPEGCILQLFNKREDVTPFQELPLQASYSLSEVCAQQYDQYGKIFTIKVQYIFYRERVGVRPGQIAKVMQGQIQSMGDFARLGMPVEHAPQVSELLKIGSLDWAEVKQLVTAVEEAMFRLPVHRDRALTYRTEEIQCVVQDELYVEQSKIGIVEKQLARVRVFFLAFLNGTLLYLFSSRIQFCSFSFFCSIFCFQLHPTQESPPLKWASTTFGDKGRRWSGVMTSSPSSPKSGSEWRRPSFTPAFRRRPLTWTRW